MTYLRKVKSESSNLYPHLYGYNYQVTLLGWELRPHNKQNYYTCDPSNHKIGRGAKRKDLQAQKRPKSRQAIFKDGMKEVTLQEAWYLFCTPQ